MKKHRAFFVSLTWLIVFLLMDACVEKIDFDLPGARFQYVVDGLISDQSTPYQVKISKSLSLEADSIVNSPVSNALITLFEDQKPVEVFFEESAGLYTTKGTTRGKVGHSYFITIQTEDGKKFQSEPETIKEVGEVKAINYEFEARKTKIGTDEVDANVFKVFIEADAMDLPENYVRWRYTGNYKMNTQPELHLTWTPPYTPYKNPPPCSGYKIVGGPPGSGGLLEKFAECTCCTCWIYEYETMPTVSNGQLIVNGQFRNIKVGEVPINSTSFYEKFMITVEQMSLSKRAYDFFRLIRAQKESASSLFQPQSGEIKGNIKPLSNEDYVIGLFWATSIKSAHTFINRSEVPYKLTPTDIPPDACTDFRNSTTVKPAFWE